MKKYFQIQERIFSNSLKEILMNFRTGHSPEKFGAAEIHKMPESAFYKVASTAFG